MLRLTKFVTRTLSVRLSLMVVCAVAVLLSVAFGIMLAYSRKTVKEDALNRASQTLDGTMQHIDNVLLSVEQSAGNIYWHAMNHLDQPDMMYVYSRKLVETNPWIVGSAIAFEPYHYKERGQYFMAYFHRAATDSLPGKDMPIVQSDSFGNTPYTEQVWYSVPMQTGKPYWTDPLKEEGADDSPVATFCVPLYGRDGKPVGVLAVDVSLAHLSQIVLSAKPSPNSYCTLLGRDGSYIVHPDPKKLFHKTVYNQLSPDDDPTAMAAAADMVAGKTGYKFFQLDGKSYYVFYKPFKVKAVAGRSTEDLGWSVGVVYPEDDIFGDYNRLTYYVVMIAVCGLLLLLLLCWFITHRQLLPLQLLTKSAQRIADGHFDESIPDSDQQDEIGRLQNNFQLMQQSLANHVGQLEQLTDTLQERGEVLKKAYEMAQEADRVKVAFLHNMSNQMIAPVNAVVEDVDRMCDGSRQLEKQDADRLAADIEQQSKSITTLLNHLLDMSEEVTRKEGSDE